MTQFWLNTDLLFLWFGHEGKLGIQVLAMANFCSTSTKYIAFVVVVLGGVVVAIVFYYYFLLMFFISTALLFSLLKNYTKNGIVVVVLNSEKG